MSNQWRSLSAFLICLLFCLSASARSQTAEPANLEQRLRQRCEGLYTAIEKSQWKKAESFLNEDAKVVWPTTKKAAISSFKIKSVSVAKDGKTGLTETIVDSRMVMPGFPGVKISAPQTVEWVWENDDWYALLRERDQEALPPVGPDGVPRITPQAQVSAAPPELEFTSRAYDFKLIRKGEAIHAKFYFTNTSDHVVKAKAVVNESCQCMTAKVSQDQFKPGEEGWVEATMETKNFGGYIYQGFEVHLQPSGAKVVLQIRGHVQLPGQNPNQ